MSLSEDSKAFRDDEALWYKDAIVYQVHVRAYCDSNEDGIGDFRGLATKLDYIHDLGVTAVWILPFYPSPLRDDGYDIADYTAVHPDYGTMADFRHFLKEAHERGIRVISELVLNHTSAQHPWFQRARRGAPGTPERDFYVWSDTPDRYRQARVLFRDFETSNWTWDPVARAYYWHRFYHHQPDLNYDNPQVMKAVLQFMDFWLDLGVDGLRLDAVPYLIEREGTTCENLPETHEALKEIHRHLTEKHEGRMLLAAANLWPEDAASYFGRNDECQMAFHFPLMPRMFMALRMEDRYPIVDILGQTPAIPDDCQWAVFLRNHDELTLEMVTDEERDYMYRVYAHDPRARLNLGIRRRLSPLLGNSRRRIELMNALLFSLIGTPVVYYGDEIGMGDNIFLGDRNGVRTPMQWSADRNAGFSKANAQRLYLPVTIDPDYHFESVNVESQLNNPGSLLWWIRRLIALRTRHRAFGRGSLEFLFPENRKVLAFVRRHRQDIVLVVANLSRHTQFVDLDLAEFKGKQLVEIFGQTEFPPIGDQPYFLTLGPHTFYWFALEQMEVQKVELAPAAYADSLPTLRVQGSWDCIFRREHREALENVLPGYLRAKRWFGGKGRRIKSVEIADAIPMSGTELATAMVLARVTYAEGDPDTYLIPLTYASEERAKRLFDIAPRETLARLATNDGEGVLTNALLDKDLCGSLLEAIERRRHHRGQEGSISARATRAFRKVRGPGTEPLEPNLLRAEQSNTSVLYGDRAILKLFRRVDEGVNPDLEIGLFLTEVVSSPHVPPVAGALEYHPRSGEPMTLAILQGFVSNEGDAWRYTLDVLSRYFERVASRARQTKPPSVPPGTALDLVTGRIPRNARELVGTYLESARLLGRRTAELHVALSTETENPDFVSEPFSPLYQRSIYQSMRNNTDKTFELLRSRLKTLDEDVQKRAYAVLAASEAVLSCFHHLLEREILALRTRIHGDYHLGQVLYTGKDFVIIDFEGQPANPLGIRRIKRSPLRDVAGMLRSFHYAGYTALDRQMSAGGMHAKDRPMLERFADFWIFWVSTAFLQAYLEVAAAGTFVPRDRSELATLLNAFLMEKVIYELFYELNNRPDWSGLPLQGILQLLEFGRSKRE
jgi:maltose alpha-D-glucosyltransferase/alpha-amylase